MIDTVYLFADESGNLDFSAGAGASRFFILTTVRAASCDFGNRILALRRELAWARRGLDSEFHASENPQVVRDALFAELAPLDFTIDATILEKAKVGAHYRLSEPGFYHFAWYRHMRRIAPAIVEPSQRILVVSASLGTAKSRRVFSEAVTTAVSWLLPTVDRRTAHWAAASDPCLVVADYCAWAIQRKWERSDARSYDLIRAKVRSEHDEFATDL